MRQRISIGLALTVVLSGIGLLVWSRQTDRFRPLFTDLSAEDAAAVVGKLKEKNIEYRLADRGANVLVPQERVAEARLEIAASGLPKSGRIGFELFDKANLGATDFAEQVNFRRALEGELERTVRTISEVEEARVHLTFPKDSVFLEHRLPAKASVLLKIRPQAEITPRNVQAMQHLVAAAVDGLSPDAVSVLDVNGNLLSRPAKTKDSAEVSDEFMEYRKKIESDLLTKVSTTLDPLLGAGKYRTAILVDLEASSGEQSEETFNPDLSVMTTSQKTEEMVAGGAGGGGIPGTASTLPRPAGRSSGIGTSVSKRTENISYQTSKTIRRLKLPQGNLRRISASVLLDQGVRWDREGSGYRKVLVPPAPETVRAIRELVSATIGIQAERGDQLVIESLPFESTLMAAPPPLPATPGADGRPATQAPTVQPWAVWLQNPFILGGVASALIVVGAGIWFLRRKQKKRKKKVSASMQAALAQQNGITPELPAGQTAMLEVAEIIKPIHTARIEQLTKTLRENMSEDPALAASVLRTWLDATAEQEQ